MITPGKIAPGQPLRLTTAFQDQATGNFVDPDTVEAQIFSPCGKKQTYAYGTDVELQKASIGNYFLDLTPDHGGRWCYRWVSTGSGAGAIEGNFNVQASRFAGHDCCCRDYR